MEARKLVSAARDLMQRADSATAGIWPRASALLARQALETALDDYWRQHAPGLERCTMRAQLLCLASYLRGDDAEYVAQRIAYAWVRLSRACHQQVYELPPTATELAAWLEIVDQFIVSASFRLTPTPKKGKSDRVPKGTRQNSV
jgi:hypothetical protein